MFLCSCGSIPPAGREAAPEDKEMLPSRYSIVCIIHGDGGYLYHDTGGNAHKADEVTLKKAITVAQRNTQAEVFIFHEKRRRHFMFIFPRRDGTFYYYRNGSLIAKESYWRDQGESRFDPETELYTRFRAEGSPKPVSMFLYFGHEIPEFGGKGYDASYGNRTFTIADLAEGLKGFAQDSTKVDLVVLSTCFNGTPYTMNALAPLARYVIASPDNLHLSYFDLSPFERLNIGLREEDVFGFAKTFARHAFDRLTEELQTAVTVVVYDMEAVRPFTRSVAGVYEQTLNSLKGITPGSIKRCDCAEDPAYVLPGINKGVTVLYRAPRFGRLKNKKSHSGWECWRFVK
ncbi:MAG: hypothetical protein U5O15_00665 [Candidatus Krumholzibacteriota bacterium]|nr:hypothetical protein [Candidatus Krumholzibacteriota bacterium]